MGRLTSRRKRRMRILQRLKLRRTRSPAHTSWWAGYRGCFIRGCILHSFCQWNWPEKMKEPFLLEECNVCFGDSYLPSSYLEDSLLHLSWRLLLISVNPMWSFPCIHWLNLTRVPVGKPQNRLVSLLRIQGPSELQDFASLNPDWKGEGNCWNVRVESMNHSQKFNGRVIDHSYNCCCVEILVPSQTSKNFVFCA